MFSLLKKFFSKKTLKEKGTAANQEYSSQLSKSLDKNLKELKPYIDRNFDIILRPVSVTKPNGVKGAVIYIKNMPDQESLQQDILRPLMNYSNTEDFARNGLNYLVDLIYKSSLSVGEIKKSLSSPEVLQSMFAGLVIVMVDGYDQALIIDITKPEHRAIDEPTTERTIRGSREGFIEDLSVNISLIRKRLADPNLVIEKTKVGRRSRTNVAIIFIEDIADPNIVQEIRDKISKIDTDGVITTSYLEQLMEDNPYSVFPQIRSTERPDKIIPELLEGRVVIMVNGTPRAIIIPSLFVSFLQATEDYNERFYVGSVDRLFRYLAFFLSISLTPLYIALLSFQPELIPFDLLVSLAMSREKVPFPIVVEVLIQEIIIQLVVEAGLRLPVTIAQTVGVVAGIVLGQAAISANLASPAIIIIIAMTTIATYSLPNYSLVLATRLIRFMMLLATSMFGLFGFSLGWLLILAHLTSLESMGVPYLSPLAPTRFRDLKDALIRAPNWTLNKRPQSIPHQDDRRQGGVS